MGIWGTGGTAPSGIQGQNTQCLILCEFMGLDPWRQRRRAIEARVPTPLDAFEVSGPTGGAIASPDHLAAIRGAYF